jgi:hypothetical protein
MVCAGLAFAPFLLIPYKSRLDVLQLESRPIALKLGTIHLLGKSFPTRYRTHCSDSK